MVISPGSSSLPGRTLPLPASANPPADLLPMAREAEPLARFRADPAALRASLQAHASRARNAALRAFAARLFT